VITETKLVQVGGQRQLTEVELRKVQRKHKGLVWKLCYVCGKLQLVRGNTKYCSGVDCGYDSLDKVTTKEVNNNVESR